MDRIGRYQYHAPGRKPVTCPHRLIRRDERSILYLFRLRSLRRGRPCLPVPTLVFPRAVALMVPLSVSAGSMHDDPLWLMEVHRALPDPPIVRLLSPSSMSTRRQGEYLVRGWIGVRTI